MRRTYRSNLLGPVLSMLLLVHAFEVDAACNGDFDGGGSVTVDEIVTMLDNALSGCSGVCLGDFNLDGRVTVDEITVALTNALNGCDTARPTATPTKLPNGAACPNGQVCRSASCVNDVCCMDSACSGSNRCDIFGFEGRCVPPLPEGAQCVTNSDCAPGLSCSVDAFGVRRCSVILPTPTFIPTRTPTRTVQPTIIVVRCRDTGLRSSLRRDAVEGDLTLELNRDTSDVFPERDGTISFHGIDELFDYRVREGRFLFLEDELPFDVGANTEVALWECNQ